MIGDEQNPPFLLLEENRALPWRVAAKRKRERERKERKEIGKKRGRKREIERKDRKETGKRKKGNGIENEGKKKGVRKRIERG